MCKTFCNPLNRLQVLTCQNLVHFLNFGNVNVGQLFYSLGELGDRRDVFHICLTGLVWLIMIGDFRVRETSRLSPFRSRVCRMTTIPYQNRAAKDAGQQASRSVGLSRGSEGKSE